DIEKCIYLNPAHTHKASTLVDHVGNDVVVFGNDRNDIKLFKESLYAVQVGDFSVLTEFADEQIELLGDYPSAIAAKILQVFA
ncbi:HAD family hydrolase, partial [Streptococcus pyogenes]